jgi:hypothetical protein
MTRKSIFGAAALFALCSTAFAHDSQPKVDPTPDAAAMRYCMTVGVRAAWGAQARFLGAPPHFKYIAEGPLKKMFWGDAKEIPTDAIYVLEELNLDQRRTYEETAFYGWKQADRWLREGREQQDYEVLAAVFYQGCKESLVAEPQGQ